MQTSRNPHDERLREALADLAEANVDLDSMTIEGRIRIRLAKNRLTSVEAAHQKWQQENQ